MSDKIINSAIAGSASDRGSDAFASSGADDRLDQLLQRTARAGVHLGLAQIEQLLARLGNPHHAVPIVHVAGTNGKGSVCAYLAAVLTQAGYRVGRYTSPHLVSWTERICIDEVPIDAETLHDILCSAAETAAAHALAPTQFELITAAAWLHFAQQAVDIAVVEVGLGGRLDATNVCDRPLATAITSIGRDHWQRLGPTLADIAGEKAGILKPGVPAVVAPVPKEAAAVIAERSREVGCPLIWVSPAAPAPAYNLQSGPQNGPKRGQTWAKFLPPSNDFSPITYPLALLGPHQYANSAVAIALLQLLQRQGWSISTQDMQVGMGKTRWPARLQWTSWQGVPLLIDGAHNAEAARALRQYIDRYIEEQTAQRRVSDKATANPAPTCWVIGMLSNKDHPEVLSALLRPGDRVCFVPVPGHQTADPENLMRDAQDRCAASEVVTAKDGFLGLDWAVRVAKACPEPPPVVLCGSIYLIGSMMARSRALAF
ncbi:MAG: bifunctional folylpolyglutamate synthase/dihydrofolate synthase [Elainellaceae cyanobacterium]